MEQNKLNIKLMADIFLTFFKLGCISFGGGYAMISLIEHEVTENKKWVEREKITDIFSVAGSLPGAIALNASAFAGYFVGGIPGAVTALVANLLPSVFIVLIIMSALSYLNANPVVASAFKGIYPAVVGLIIYAAYKIGKTALKDVWCVVLAVLSFVFALVLKLPLIPIIIGGGVCGAAITYIKAFAEYKKSQKLLKDGDNQ